MFKFQPHGWLRGRRGNAPALTWLPLLLFFLIPRPLFAGADDDSSSRPVGAGREVGEEANEPTNFEAVLQICVTAGFHQVKLSWDPPTTTPTSYHVQYRTTSSGPWENVLVIIMNSPYTVMIPHSAAAADPETFSFQIRSYFATTTTFSDFVTIDSIERAPPSGEPTNLMVGPRSGADENDQSARLNWDLITDPAARYLVESKESNDPETEWFSHDDDTLSAGTSAVVVYDLKKGNNTDFRVKGLGPCAAISAFAADTSYSNVVTSSDGGPSITKPETPDRPVAIPYYDRDDRAVLDSVVLTWVLPENGGADIDRQEIERLVFPIGGGTSTSDTFAITSAGTLRYKDSEGLMPGNDYYYLVRVHNSEGWSDFSDRSVKVTYPVALVSLDPPTGLAAEALAGTDDIRLTWTTPSPMPDKYEIQKRSDENDAWTLVSFDVDGALEVYTHAGVGPGTTLFYRIRAKNDDGAESPWHPAASDPSVSATTEGESLKPSAPRNLVAAEDGHSAVDLDWDAPSDSGGAPVIGYRLQRRRNNLGNFRDVAGSPQNQTTTKYRDATVAAATAYEYRVAARNALASWGPWSNIAEAETEEAPENREATAPTGLTATARDQTAIALAWSAPADTGTSAITGYRIEVSSNGGAVWTNLVANTGATDTSYRHRGLQAGTTRHYRVSAINSAGTGKPSNVASATTKETETTVPGAPTDLTATARGQSRIDLAWAAPSSDGGSPVTGYQVEVSANAGTAWAVLVSNTNSSTTNYSQTGLSAATTRHYRVSAINAEGTGPVSNVASTRTGAGVPGAPSGLVAARKGQSQIDLIWTAPSDDGGSEVTGYRIEFSKNGGQSWLVLVNNTASAATTYSDTGLSPGTSRHYRVSAINAEGTGPASNIAHASAGITIPGAPTNLTAAAQGQTRIALFWAAPSDSGGAAVTGYRIEVSENAGLGWGVLVQNTGSTSTTHSHTGLAAGTTRHYRVSAINAAGIGPASNVAQATTGASAPDAPTELKAKANGTSQIDLSWTAPANDGGSPIIGYRIQASSDQEPGWFTLADNTGSAATLYSHANLSPASTWRYRVQATNAMDRSPESEEARATTAAALPEAPTELTAVARGPSWIELSWEAPTYTGGVPIQGYKIEVHEDESSLWIVLVANTRSTGTTDYPHLGLDPGSTRYYRVSAINSAGVGPESDVARATTDPVVPSKPTGLTATVNGTSQIDLAWSPPDEDGGAPISGYRIEVFTEGATGWAALLEDTRTSTTEYSHTGLEPASTWTYRVSAINSAGYGNPSTMARATTEPDVPAPPVDLTATANGTSRIDLAWEAPAYDGGAPITGYRVEVSENSGASWSVLVADTRSTTSVFPHESLSPASTRHYRVSATNRAGTGAPSATAFATTDATVPDPPTRLDASARDHSQIDLSWQTPAFDGGSRITGHRIEVSENAGLDWRDLVANTGSTNTTYEHAGLPPATTRHYRVSAINQLGTGSPSNVVSATTDATVPDPPRDLVALATSPTRIDLVWRAPVYDGGAPVTSYRVEVSADGDRWTDLVPSTGQTTSSYAHTGLSPGTTRFYRVSAINVAGTGLPSGVAAASTDDPLQRAGRVNEAVLPRFGAAMTTSTLSAIAGRIEAVAVGNPLASQLSAAGLLSLTGTPVSSDPGRGPSMRRLLDGTSFVLPLGGGSEGQQAGSNFSVGTWGNAHHHRMGEPGAEEVQWEGQMLTVHLGTDVRVHRDLLAGVAGSRSSGNYDFTDVTGNRKVSGTYEPRMTSVSPYLAWLPGRTGVTIWTAGSFGWGQVAIDDEIEGIRRSDMRMMAGALGGSRILMSNATSSLRLRAEGWLSRIELPGAEGVDSLTLQIRRARAALEWSQEYDFDSGSRVGIVVEGGMRYGQGDGPEGTRARMEIGGGLRYVSPSGRVTLEGHGRSLVADGSGYEERGFRGLLQVAPQGGKRGLSFKLMPVWGNATSRVQELWERGVSDTPGSSHANLRGRLNTEIVYGLPSFDGTLYGRFNIVDGGTRSFATGMRYQAGQALALRVEGTLNQNVAGPARPGLALRGRWRLRHR